MKNIILLILLFISGSAFSQRVYDSTVKRTDVNSYNSYVAIEVKDSGFIRVPRDTFTRACKDSGAIAYKNGVFYYWKCPYWRSFDKLVSSPDGSISITQNGQNVYFSTNTTGSVSPSSFMLSPADLQLDTDTVSVNPNVLFVLNGVKDTITTGASWKIRTLGGDSTQTILIYINQSGALDTLQGVISPGIAVPPSSSDVAIIVGYINVTDEVDVDNSSTYQENGMAYIKDGKIFVDTIQGPVFNHDKKTFRISPMSTTAMNAIASPISGDLIFNTTENAFYYYNGSAWVKIEATTGGGGISAADVGFVARNQFQPTYPIFYDNSWTTTTSNNYVVNGVTASVVSGKVEVTGNGNNYTQAYYKNQNSYLEHWQKTDTITIVSSPSATTYGITTGILNASSAVGLNVGFVDLTTGTDAGKCYIITSGGTTSATSVGAITFSQNDTLILNFKQERDTLTFTVLNKNNASTQTVQYIMTTAYVFNNVIAHARGLYGFAVKGGTYRIVGTKVENQEYVNRTLAVLGDSKTQGYYAGTWAARYGDKLNALQLGGSGDYIVDILSRWNDIAMLQPKQVLLSIGSNNLRGSETISNVINSYKGLVGMLNGRGIKVFHICPPEGGSLSYKVYQLDSFIRRTYPLEYIDVYTTMNTMRSTLLNSDSVHINAAGNDTIYQIVNRSGLIGNPIYDQSAQQRNIYDGLNTVTVADSLNLLRNGGNTNGTELLIGAASNNFVSLISSGRKVMRFNWAPPVIFTSLNYAGSEIFRLTGDSLGNTGAGNLAGINITSSGNSFYGDRAGSSITGASQSNVIVGAFAYAGLTPAASRNRNIGLGYQAGYYETRSDRLYIGSNGSSRSPLIYGDNSTGQVAINPTYVAATASTVDTSAQFEITSTNRGLLIPRLTTVQRGTIPTPATSLLIYNTTVDSFQYYQGGAWRNLGGGSGSSGITRGTTAIASGTATRVLYDSSGTVGEYSISGTGSVAMTASPTFTGTISADDISANSASLASTTTGFLPNRVTTTQMNAIASPSDGMMIYNTTEGAIFSYNTDWGWESPSMKYRTKFGTEYFNELLGIQSTASGFTNDGNINIFASGGVASSVVASTTNRQGIIELSTSTSATGRSGIATASGTTNQTMILGGGRILFETSVQIPTLSTSGERFQALFGLSSTNNSVNISNGVMFLYDEGGVSTGSAASANWQVYTAASSSRTFTSTSVAVTAGQWYKLTAIINAAGTSVGFYIDDVLVRTETATIPTAAIGIEHQIFKSNGTTARTALVDYVYFKQKYTTTK